MVNFSLEGKVALVTGASYGIGFALATAFAEAGAKIAFNDIKQELVDKGIAAYKEKGIDAKGYVCDVTNEDQVNELVAKIEKDLGVIDILVNNAGIIKRIPMTEMSAAQFRQVIDVDLNAPFIVAKAIIPDMIEQGGGKIINICSMSGMVVTGDVGSSYAAAKAGLIQVTKSLGCEWIRYGINVNGISPGMVRTALTDPMFEGNPEAVAEYDALIPLGRMAVTSSPLMVPVQVAFSTALTSEAVSPVASLARPDAVL